jgi:hypothetical protein
MREWIYLCSLPTYLKLVCVNHTGCNGLYRYFQLGFLKTFHELDLNQSDMECTWMLWWPDTDKMHPGQLAGYVQPTHIKKLRLVGDLHGFCGDDPIGLRMMRWMDHLLEKNDDACGQPRPWPSLDGMCSSRVLVSGRADMVPCVVWGC